MKAWRDESREEMGEGGRQRRDSGRAGRGVSE